MSTGDLVITTDRDVEDFISKWPRAIKTGCSVLESAASYKPRGPEHVRSATRRWRRNIAVANHDAKIAIAADPFQTAPAVSIGLARDKIEASTLGEKRQRILVHDLADQRVGMAARRISKINSGTASGSLWPQSPAELTITRSVP